MIPIDDTVMIEEKGIKRNITGKTEHLIQGNSIY